MVDCDARPRSFRELSRVTEEHYFPHTVTMESQVLLRESGLICRDLGEVSLVKLNWGVSLCFCQGAGGVLPEAFRG